MIIIATVEFLLLELLPSKCSDDPNTCEVLVHTLGQSAFCFVLAPKNGLDSAKEEE